VQKNRYKTDLRGLHALCEANYARLLRLFPDYEARNTRSFTLQGMRVQIDVLERSRYTTLFRLNSVRSSQSATEAARASAASTTAPAESNPHWLPTLRIEARAYHDAAMLEVVAFQSEARIAARYSYPNRAMHQEDEKRQQNAFLADWLAHSQHHGEADLGAFLPLGSEPA
jgi:uncharacterized protein YqiB (DUF1249 family)